MMVYDDLTNTPCDAIHTLGFKPTINMSQTTMSHEVECTRTTKLHVLGAINNLSTRLHSASLSAMCSLVSQRVALVLVVNQSITIVVFVVVWVLHHHQPLSLCNHFHHHLPTISVAKSHHLLLLIIHQASPPISSHDHMLATPQLLSESMDIDEIPSD